MNTEVAKTGGLGLMEEYEKTLLENFECMDIPAENVTHDGILLRKCYMPAGKLVCGHEHKHSHWNIVMTGKAIVSQNGEHSKIEAGDVFVSEPNVKKGLFIIEDMEFITIHKNPDGEIENDKLEDIYVKKSSNYNNNVNLIKIKEEKCLGE